VAALADVPENQPVRVMADRTPVLLVRRGTTIRAIAETCSHLSGPLAEGRLDGNTIQCPWHGSTFCIDDGSVVRGPATHPQPVYEARVRDGGIEIRQPADGAQ
jgi:nitrite reductase/ring-hydroxylating ferredoxin subunit